MVFEGRFRRILGVDMGCRLGSALHGKALRCGHCASVQERAGIKVTRLVRCSLYYLLSLNNRFTDFVQADLRVVRIFCELFA